MMLIVNVALGKPKYAFVDNEIVYFNIYLANGEKIISQIGVYEIMEESLPNITDNDGEPDLTKMNEPLLYSFVDDEFLNKSLTTKDEDENKMKINEEINDLENNDNNDDKEKPKKNQ